MAIQDGTVLVFGIDATSADLSASTQYGLLQEYSIHDQINRSTCISATGETVAIQEHGRTKQLRANYMQLATSTQDPAIGTAFVFAGSTWQLDNIKEGHMVDGFETRDIEATNYPYIH